MAVDSTIAYDSPPVACSRNFAFHQGFRTIPAVVLLILAVAHSVTAPVGVSQVAVTTYHYNNMRTGWNRLEMKLTPASVSSAKFGILQTVSLDERVDAQPLVVPQVVVTAGNFQGLHNVVYVATANNTVYMIDADNGTVLWSQ